MKGVNIHCPSTPTLFQKATSSELFLQINTKGKYENKIKTTIGSFAASIW